jgi:folylpolyglutamate synthase/dihydropteroate synthase
MKLDALRRCFVADRPACVVAAVGRSKNLKECAVALARLGPLFVVTEFGPAEAAGAGPRSWPASELGAALRRHGSSVEVAPTPEAAAVAVLGATKRDDTILVTGSFLHLSDVRDQLSRLG